MILRVPNNLPSQKAKKMVTGRSTAMSETVDTILEDGLYGQQSNRGVRMNWVYSATADHEIERLE